MWHETWTYEEVIIPANGKAIPEESLGFMHMCEDQHGQKHRLWMYVAHLQELGDYDALIEVAKRGDGLARGRALLALANIAPENAEFLRILYAWFTAETYADTIGVSESICADSHNFKITKLLATSAYNQLRYPTGSPLTTPSPENTPAESLTDKQANELAKDSADQPAKKLTIPKPKNSTSDKPKNSKIPLPKRKQSLRKPVIKTPDKLKTAK